MGTKKNGANEILQKVSVSSNKDLIKTLATVPISEIKKALFLKGNLSYKLKDYQKKFYTGLHRDIDFQVILCCRRFGKTFTLLTYAIEHCIKKPNYIVRVIAPTYKQLTKIITPSIRKILSDCPESIYPEFKKQEGLFKFKNGSEIHLLGGDNGNAENVRGFEADLFIIDEAGYFSDFEYVLNSIILPTVLETNGKIIISSTRAKTPVHYYEQLVDEAEIRGDLLRFDINDTDYSEQQLLRMKEKVGGENSTDWKREFLNERIIDENRAVITTWKDSNIQEYDSNDQYNSYYHRYVGADLGFSRDFTVFLFATYHFPTATLYIHDEFYGKKQSTRDIAQAVKAKEKEIFNNIIVYMRVGDSDNPLLYHDLNVEYQYPIFPVHKTSREAMLNKLTVWFQEDRIKISSKCKLLLTTIKSALWNRSKTDFERNENIGHADSLMALVYLVISVDVFRNPIPFLETIDRANTYIIQEENQIPTNYRNREKNFNSLKNAFGKS